MKTKLFTISLAFIGFNSFAQITVADTDLMNVGDIIYQAYDDAPTSSISLGNAGPNQTWDFSTLQAQEYDTTEFIDPTGTPFGIDHPTANLCIDDNGEYIYIDKNAQGLNLVGFDNFPYPQLVVPLPLTYGLNTIVGPVIIMDSVIDNSLLPDSMAVFITMGQAQQIDSIQILIESSTEFNVDAHGDVIIPMGTFDALRVKTDDVTTTDYFLYCSDTVTGNGNWYPMPAAIAPSEVEIISSYAWWTNDPLIKFALVQIEIDSLGGIDAIDFMHSPSSSSVADLLTNNFNIYPIPAINNLTIETQNNELASLELVDLTGKVILKKEFTQSTSLDVSRIAKGIHYINLKTVEGELAKQIVIE
ncbi:MAG: T9SS type A sorting domain-containing protein [Flavobacteriales bacterium]|jgi:hypothetical protein|nr:T9SS type A sorting domain-containing protein [Flavobacteriales bacterium]MBT5090752.1 T9SS type A sorting domain-containing protein [Flavobacteriales bacterium]MBT6169404.1 T9SS type A sorting domain-containing protein [Flavobacteriaceae bacterium]